MRRKLLSLALALVMCLGLAAPALAADTGFVIENGILASYTGPGGKVIIPDSVREINRRAFLNRDDITSITIPNTVKKIDINAFSNCGGLTVITIPASVTEIGDPKIENPNLARGCSRVSEINVDPDNRIFTSKDGVLFSKDMTQLIECPPAKTGTYTVPDGVKTIFDYAFWRCTGLTEITFPASVVRIGFWSLAETAITGFTIPDSVKDIRQGAFTGCKNLSSIMIPATVTELGGLQFQSCSALREINVDPDNPACASVDGVLYSKSLRGLREYPASKSGPYTILDSVEWIEDHAFKDCTGITELVIPAGLTDIPLQTFQGCALKAFTVDPGNSAFASADGVLYSKDMKRLIAYPGGKGPTFTIPSGVYTVGSYAFSSNSALTSVTIPASVSTFGAPVFDGCSSLVDIHVAPESQHFMDVDGVLFSKDKKTLFTYPAARKGAYRIPEGTTSIRKHAFQRTPGLTEVVIPEGVTDINLFAFNRCPDLTSVFLPASLTSLESAFDNTVKDIYYAGSAEEWEKVVPMLEVRDYVEVHPDTPAPVTAPSFTDVPADAYFAAPVAWAVKNGITSGTGDNKFSPNQNCTNAQILTFIWRAYGEPEPTVENPFTNSIPDGYAKAAVWASEKGMVSGTTFDVDKPCTRAMAMTYLWQAADSPETEPTGKFTDVAASDPYAQAVAWAVANGITKGATDTTFAPESICQRGQIAVFLYNAVAKN